MKKIFLCLLFLSGSIIAKETSVECHKLITLLLENAELRKNFPVNKDQQKEFSTQWEMMDEKGRQYVEMLNIIKESHPELIPPDIQQQEKKNLLIFLNPAQM